VNVEIKVDDLSDPRIAALLQEHLDDMYRTSPPESVHALDLSGLKKPEITFWSVWNGDELVGCGALKRLDAEHAELKSMRTPNAHRGKGIGKIILEHILNEARQRGYRRVSLETGSMEFFKPARTLYASYGFETCGPFADYWDDPNSFFMTRSL
jgi:putative acetyltransferase